VNNQGEQPDLLICFDEIKLLITGVKKCYLLCKCWYLFDDWPGVRLDFVDDCLFCDKRYDWLYLFLALKLET